LGGVLQAHSNFFAANCTSATPALIHVERFNPSGRATSAPRIGLRDGDDRGPLYNVVPRVGVVAERLVPTGALGATLDVLHGEHVEAVAVLTGSIPRRRMVQLPGSWRGGAVYRPGAGGVAAYRGVFLGEREA